MKPTQQQSWTEVTHLFEAALELRPDERGAFLERACAGDAELCREVQSLLEADAEAGKFMEVPACEEEPLTSGANLPTEGGATEPSVDAPEEELKPGSPLGRYVVRERLGTGGMGVVYLADDPELNRKIAIKLMRPGTSGNLSASEGRARLMREAQAMAQLSHPNVIAVYDVGTFGDQVFIAMEYVEGSTLTGWLAGQDRPWREIVNMFVQTGRGLAAAHAVGILHRDFKPDNVLVGKDGRPRVLDFGLACALFGEPQKSAPVDESARADENSPSNLVPFGVALTEPGRLMGTPAYMAPEQLMGQGADHRTDQYSFCVALYQGLYGKLPFKGRSTETLVREMSQGRTPEAPSSQVPPRLRRVVLRGLHPQPAERYPSMDALTDELVLQAARTRRGVVAVAELALLGAIISSFAIGGTYLYVRRRDAHNQGGAVKSLVVLPFLNAGANPDAEYLSDGIAESLIDNLSQIPELQVIARDTAFRYKGKDPDLQKLRGELRVDVALTGQVQRRGDTLLVRVDLVNLANGSELWGKKYGRRITDLVALEEDLAKSISDKLRPRLAPEVQQRVTRLNTENSEAYQLYLRGRYFWNKRTKESLNQGIDYFQRALVLDPKYALAYAGLADSYTLLPFYTSAPRKETSELAEAAAQKAIALDDGLAEAHAALGNIRMMKSDWQGGERELRRAIELNPNYAPAHNWLGVYLHSFGRLDQAMGEFTRAQQLDPSSAVYTSNLGFTLCSSGQYDRGIAQLKDSLQLDPVAATRVRLARSCYVPKKMYWEAIDELKEGMNSGSPTPVFLSTLAWLYALSGDKDQARILLKQFPEPDGSINAAFMPYSFVPYYQSGDEVAGSAFAAPPAGWMLAGMAPQDYEMGVDKSVNYGGKPSAYIRSAKPTPSGFSTLNQMFTAAPYHGKRVRFSAQVKSDAVANWAGLWLRVDGSGGQPLAIDNMQDRPISGTASWKHYEVVLDVADKATNVALGILLDGPGVVWISDIKFEAVDKTVATTGRPITNDEPTNLDFSGGEVAGSAFAAPPAGWMLSGRAPQDYEMGVDKSVNYGGKPSAYIRSAKPTPSGFSTLNQMFTAAPYHGKRVRFSAQVKSDAVANWAGLWLRVDGSGGQPLAIDNMQDRPISGTASWKHYEVVLDVADEATNVALGILLDGPGVVWISDIKFETVDKTVATTGFE